MGAWNANGADTLSFTHVRINKAANWFEFDRIKTFDCDTSTNLLTRVSRACLLTLHIVQKIIQCW